MFTSALNLTEAPQPDFWAVASPLVWTGEGLPITVPKGFLTDLASIPRVLRNLPMLDPDGCSRSPAVLHDWLYRTHQYTRQQSDAILRQALIERGANKVDAWSFYLGVRLGGASAYNAHPNGPCVADFDTTANYLEWCMVSGSRPA